MILVTLGTQDKSFKRLLEAIDKQIVLGNIKDQVIVQAGHTKYKSDNMTIFDFIPYDEFDDYELKKNFDKAYEDDDFRKIVNDIDMYIETRC